MDLFLAICLGLGLALAAGLVIGVVLPPIMPDWGVLAGAAPLGVLACAAALSGNEEELEVGHTFSVEPGIYFAGRQGARIEDIVACAESGADMLNVASRDLYVVRGT